MGCSTYRNTSSNGTTHANRQELQADLVGGVHPAETFAGDIAEVGALIATAGQLRSPRLMKRMKQAHYSASTMWLSSTASNFSGTIPLKSTNDRVILKHQRHPSCTAVTARVQAEHTCRSSGKRDEQHACHDRTALDRPKS